MTNKVDNWQKLARYDTNIQGELHANLLKNNGIEVSLQALSALPGLNSGIVLWVQQDDLAKAQRILNDIAVDVDMDSADMNGDDDLGAIDERGNGK
ncbi:MULTISPECIES: DUF2007 domain-containing protein [Psychrobacter]|uniref:DUF2007 domain-containing protein n=1 Tax=Psychrobacter TaxID=497 RepID=UPI00146AC117|nr:MULTISPECIES: DUF2007 domain-containing protein [Psychrobacter]